MADKFDKETRSYIMSRIRGKWTEPEMALHNRLKAMKVRHKMHPKTFGNPDIYLKDSNTVIFIDGCFWHGCPEHGHIPKTKKRFWRAKIERNMARDRRYTKELKRMGFNVIRVWECELEQICRKFSCLNMHEDLYFPRQLCNMVLTVADVRRTIKKIPAAERVMPTLVFDKAVYTWDGIITFIDKNQPPSQKRMLIKIRKIRGSYGKGHRPTKEEKMILRKRFEAMPSNIRIMTIGKCLTKKDIILQIEKDTELGMMLARRELNYLNKLWLK